MNREEFDRFRDEQYAIAAGINKDKGKDYAGDEDALANFKAAAEQLGIEPEQVWAVYAHKHWSAIMSYAKAGQVASEPIEGRLHDMIVYCFLLLGIIEDRKAAEPPPLDRLFERGREPDPPPSMPVAEWPPALLGADYSAGVGPGHPNPPPFDLGEGAARSLEQMSEREKLAAERRASTLGRCEHEWYGTVNGQPEARTYQCERPTHHIGPHRAASGRVTW